MAPQGHHTAKQAGALCVHTLLCCLILGILTPKPWLFFPLQILFQMSVLGGTQFPPANVPSPTT